MEKRRRKGWDIVESISTKEPSDFCLSFLLLNAIHTIYKIKVYPTTFFYINF